MLRRIGKRRKIIHSMYIHSTSAEALEQVRDCREIPREQCRCCGCTGARERQEVKGTQRVNSDSEMEK